MSAPDVRLTEAEREALARAQHHTWHIGCEHECGGRLDDAIKSARCIAPVVERIIAARVQQVEAERDEAQEHLAYHLRDFRPTADMGVTGDLAVDMAPRGRRGVMTAPERLAQVAEVLCAGVPGIECSHVENKQPSCVRDAQALAPLLTQWQAEDRAAERERIALAIHAAKPTHLTRDYTAVDQAYDTAARIAYLGRDA